MKRIVLFALTNIAVMFVLMVVFHLVCAFFGVDPNAAFARNGTDLTSLAIFSLVYGMTGGFVSLLLSKTIAKMTTRARTITGDEGEAERRLAGELCVESGFAEQPAVELEDAEAR